MVRLSLLLLSFLFPIVAFASESSAQEQWKAFLTKPSANTYEPLSGALRMCVVTGCHDAEVAGAKDNFANLYKLLDLAEHGNHYAMEIARGPNRKFRLKGAVPYPPVLPGKLPAGSGEWK